MNKEEWVRVLRCGCENNEGVELSDKDCGELLELLGIKKQ